MTCIALRCDEPCPAQLWHGTSWESAQRIKRVGFIESESGLLGPGIYVAREHKARRFAEDQLRHRGSAGGCGHTLHLGPAPSVQSAAAATPVAPHTPRLVHGGSHCTECRAGWWKCWCRIETPSMCGATIHTGRTRATTPAVRMKHRFRITWSGASKTAARSVPSSHSWRPVPVASMHGYSTICWWRLPGRKSWILLLLRLPAPTAAYW